MSALEASAIARANIALAKYWGKSDVRLNLPAVPSISLTLDALMTTTRVRFDETLSEDRVILDGNLSDRKASRRAVKMLDEVRSLASLEMSAEVITTNSFPTAAGLASSASGFAALAGAAAAAAGLKLSDPELSRMARRASASAARSIFGGFVELPSGAPGDDGLSASPLYGVSHWDLSMVIALTATGPKKVGSTEGMERSRMSSPYYEAWIKAAPGLADRVRKGIESRDLGSLGRAMEESTLAFHCCAITASPPIIYWRPATLSVLHRVHELREEGLNAWATMDAGPHVKVLCERSDEERLAAELGKDPSVLEVLRCRPAGGLQVTHG
jgi:diphosphomevalonate decarboxylase